MCADVGSEGQVHRRKSPGGDHDRCGGCGRHMRSPAATCAGVEAIASGNPLVIRKGASGCRIESGSGRLPFRSRRGAISDSVTACATPATKERNGRDVLRRCCGRSLKLRQGAHSEDKFRIEIRKIRFLTIAGVAGEIAVAAGCEKSPESLGWGTDVQYWSTLPEGFGCLSAPGSTIPPELVRRVGQEQIANAGSPAPPRGRFVPASGMCGAGDFEELMRPELGADIKDSQKLGP